MLISPFSKSFLELQCLSHASRMVNREPIRFVPKEAAAVLDGADGYAIRFVFAFKSAGKVTLCASIISLTFCLANILKGRNDFKDARTNAGTNATD